MVIVVGVVVVLESIFLLVFVLNCVLYYTHKYIKNIRSILMLLIIVGVVEVVVVVIKITIVFMYLHI